MKHFVKTSFKSFPTVFEQRFLGDNTLFDFRQKHLFIARLRIFIFIAAWVMFFVFYPAIWLHSPFAVIIFNLGFFITTACYWFVLKDKPMLPIVLVEFISDIISQTAIIYIFGFKGAAPFVVYGLYVAGAGSLIGSFAAFTAAFFCVAIYSLTFMVIGLGGIPEFYYPPHAGDLIYNETLQFYFTLIFLPFILGFTAYSLHIMNYFFYLKKKALERRHIQLTALNNIGSTIRRALNTQNVIHQVLRGVTTGLRFEVCLLALLDDSRSHFRFYVSEENYYARKIQELLGIRFQDLVLPMTEDKNAINVSIKRNRVVIRNKFIELIPGFFPKIDPNKVKHMQFQLGFRKFVMTPMEVEQKGMGVIIGVSTSEFIDDTVIDTLDNFANQAALAIESAQLFEALNNKNYELIRANKVKSDFLAVMSHELRTPLNAVIGFSEILMDEMIGNLNDEQKKSVKEILSNAKNLLELINNILDLAKLEAGKMELNIETFDFTDMLNDVHNAIEPLIDKKKQNFVLKVEQDLPLLHADPMKIRQILLNLLSNAIKFTDTEGRIEVFLDYFEKAEDIISAEFAEQNFPVKIRENPAFYLVVKDNGVGIDKKQINKIFEDFSQVDTSFTRTHQGTGLGLALTKQLILLHSGTISVKSEQGQGSEFRILLPQEQVLTHQRSQNKVLLGS